MREIIDNQQYLKHTEISTPVEAEKHYLPLLISGEYDLMAIKKELREIHHFSDEDVRISSRFLSSAHFKHLQENANGAQKYVLLAIGGLLFCIGLFLILYLWDRGWVSTVPFIMSGAGILMMFRSKAFVKE